MAPNPLITGYEVIRASFGLSVTEPELSPNVIHDMGYIRVGGVEASVANIVVAVENMSIDFETIELQNNSSITHGSDFVLDHTVSVMDTKDGSQTQNVTFESDTIHKNLLTRSDSASDARQILSNSVNYSTNSGHLGPDNIRV